MGYSDEVLADNPIVYYRLDQLGFGTNGESVPDLSGNGLDATLTFSGTSGAAWGHPSPIETDASSREFHGYTNAGLVGLDGSSLITRASHSLMTVSGDFTVEEWLRPMDELALAGTFAMVSKQGTGGTMLTVSGGTRIGGFCFDTAATLWQVFDPSIAVLDYLGTSFHVVVFRSGNALALYINGTLRNTTTITSGLPTLFNSNPFRIHPAAGAYTNARHDEAAYYDYALSGTRILAHYEAALATLLSSATITVRVPVSLDTDVVEPVDFPFTHNWANPIGGQERVITEHLSWHTLTNQSEPDYLQRVAGRRTPRRELEYAITPVTAQARRHLQRLLWQPAGFYKLPIATDWMPLTAQANVSDAVLNCDTTLRDYEVDSYVSVWQDVYDPSTCQTFRITSVSDTQLGITPTVSAILPIDSPVMPARLSNLPDESLDFDGYVIDKEATSLRFEILDTELSTRRITAYTPVTTYLSTEVFSLDSARYDTLEEAPYNLRRRQSGTGLLTGNDYLRAVDTASLVTIPVRVLLTTRAQLSGFYGWLDARQGRRNPIWIPSKENDLEFKAVVSSGVNTVLKVAGYAIYNLHYQRRDIQVVYSDGSVANRRITTNVDNGDGTENITMLGIPSGTIAKISWLRRCVAADSFELRFHRDLSTAGGMIVECAFELMELLTS